MSESYRVYATSFASQGTFRRAQETKYFHAKGTPEGSEKQRKIKNKKIKQVKSAEDSNIRNVTTSTPPQSVGNFTEATKQKLESLKSQGINVDQIICFMCLGRHRCRACPHYDQKVEYGELCTKVINGATF